MDHKSAIAAAKLALEEAVKSGCTPAKLQQRLTEMIAYSRLVHDWYEDQRNRLLAIGLTLIALPIPVCTIVVEVLDPSSIPNAALLFGAVALLAITVTGLYIIWEYRRLLAADWPHREFADIRSWYFIYNLPHDMPDSLSDAPGVRAEQIAFVGKKYLDNVNRWLEFAKEENRFILEDIEQVYILQLFQRYRRQSLKKMVDTLFIGLVIFAICSILSIGCWFVLGGHLKSADVVSCSLWVRLNWRSS